MLTNLVERRYAETNIRLSRINVLGATVIWLLCGVSVWGQWKLVAYVVAVQLFLAPFNMLLNLVLIKRWGLIACELLRTPVNMIFTVIFCRLAHWPSPVWLWLPFAAMAFDHLSPRVAAGVLVGFCLPLDLFALLDGVPPMFPLMFTLLAVHCSAISKLRYAAIHQMLVSSDEQCRALDDALQTQRLSEARLASTRREAEAKASVMQRQLLDISRKAGMAEIATSVLHNIGNVLNSVNVSATVAGERVRNSKLGGLAKAVQLLRDHEPDLPAFFASDTRARQLPRYLTTLTSTLEAERGEIGDELKVLQKNIDHIKVIVGLQQAHAKAGGLIESVPLAGLLDDAIQFDLASYQRHGIEIVREYQELPAVAVDRHRLLQIITNLLTNARHAVEGSGQTNKHIVVGLRHDTEGIAISVAMAKAVARPSRCGCRRRRRSCARWPARRQPQLSGAWPVSSLRGRARRISTPRKSAMPATIAGRKMRPARVPTSAEMMAGPGQKPPMPQPAPNRAEPTSRRASRAGGG